jgi:hypothetical protein
VPRLYFIQQFEYNDYDSWENTDEGYWVSPEEPQAIVDERNQKLFDNLAKNHNIQFNFEHRKWEENEALIAGGFRPESTRYGEPQHKPFERAKWTYNGEHCVEWDDFELNGTPEQKRAFAQELLSEADAEETDTLEA